MANLLKFYRGAVAPSAQVGMIWFDVTNQVIKVCTAAPEGVDATWEVYGTTPADLEALAGRVTTLEGAVKTLNETTLPALKAELEQAIATAVAAEAKIARDAEKALADRLDVIEGEANVEGSIKKAVADAKAELIGDAETLKTFGAVEDAIAAAEAAAKAAASVVVEGTDAGNNLEIVPTVGENGATTYTVNLTDVASAATLAAIKSDVDYFFSDALNKENAEALKDTLKEIQTYIDSDVAAAAALTQSVAENKAAIEAEVSRATTAEGNLQTAINNEVSAREAAIAALDAEVTSTDGAKVTVKVTEVDGKITAVNVTESDIASAADLATLDAEVQEHEVVVAAALNDLHDRMTTAEGEIDALQATVGGLDLGVSSLTASTSSAHVTVSPVSASKGDVTLTVDVASVDAAAGGATGLATDAYVAEQLAPVAATAGSAVQTVASAGETLQVTRDANAVNVELCWMEGSF
jgi:hypothetical protein